MLLVSSSVNAWWFEECDEIFPHFRKGRTEEEIEYGVIYYSPTTNLFISFYHYDFNYTCTEREIIEEDYCTSEIGFEEYNTTMFNRVSEESFDCYVNIIKDSDIIIVYNNQEKMNVFFLTHRNILSYYLWTGYNYGKVTYLKESIRGTHYY